METADILARRTLDSGLTPIEWNIRPLLSFADEVPCGGLIDVRINSILYGVLEHARYADAVDMSETGITLTLRVAKKILAYAATLSGTVRQTFYLPAPAALLLADDPYALLTEAFGAVERRHRCPVVFTFSEEILSEEKEKITKSIADLHAAGFSVAIRGFGTPDFPTAKLMAVTPDALFLDGGMCAYAADPFRSGAVASLVRFATGLHIAVHADGVKSDDELRALSAADCTAFRPEKSYRGRLTLPPTLLTPEAYAAWEKGGEDNR